MRTEKKHSLRQLRHWRIRKKVSGTSERPRMSVCFTGQHIYVQFIDDIKGQTVAAATTRSKELPSDHKFKANVESAKRLGQIAAEAAKKAGVEKVVFDRAGARYHGKIKALADAAREAGLQF